MQVARSLPPAGLGQPGSGAALDWRSQLDGQDREALVRQM